MTDENPYYSPTSSAVSTSGIGRVIVAGTLAFGAFMFLSCGGVINVLYIGPSVMEWNPEDQTQIGQFIAGLVAFFLSYWYLIAIAGFFITFPLFFRLLRRKPASE